MIVIAIPFSWINVKKGGLQLLLIFTYSNTILCKSLVFREKISGSSLTYKGG